MRNLAFLAAGLGLLIAQANVYRLLDGVTLGWAAILWLVAASVDASRILRRAPWQARALSIVRADWTLPATVLLGYALLASVFHGRVGRPIPALVLPLILFMGVHEYSLARGASVAFVLGYATDVVGIAPIGLYTFTYVATFILARAAGVRLAAQTTWIQVLFVGAFATLQSAMVLVLLAIFGRDPWVPKSLYLLTFPHAIATAAAAPALFHFAQAIHAASGGTARAPSSAGLAR